jgi:Flp pilus assembly protein TadG
MLMRTSRHKTSSRLRRDNGQTLVEFALVLPLLVLLVFGLLQFGVAFHNYLGITDATRVAARAAAVKRTHDPCGAARTAIQQTVSTRQWSQISSRVTCAAGSNVGDPVTITITYPYSIGLPGFSKSGDLTASAQERLE